LITTAIPILKIPQKHLQTTLKTFQSTMVVTTNMGEFISNIRNERMNQFWNDTKKYQKFSPTTEEMVENAPPGTFDDAEEDVVETSSDGLRHYKMMCNTTSEKKRYGLNSPTSKSIVKACAADGIHILNALDSDGTEYKCYNQAKPIRPGDMAHMYYGDLAKNNPKHYVGKVVSSYDKFSKTTTLDEFPEIKKVWPHTSQCAIFCRVDWQEVVMTSEDEYMLKNPGKNGFPAQGTILRVR